MVKVEACINSDAIDGFNNPIKSAYLGGAARVELCSSMQFYGLTPKKEHIIEARKAFGNKKGLMVMIRPRKGDFSYSKQEIIIMHRQIQMAAEAGADGVVFGVLQKSDNRLNKSVFEELLQTCNSNNLQLTFHRAFDACPNPLETLDQLLELGVDRILTSGIPWGQKGNALEGVGKLNKYISQVNGKIEIVVGGGVNPSNVKKILNNLSLKKGNVSVHAYSGVQENGITTATATKTLVDAVKDF
ncbi:MAG: copper homeostasis protein CutC [Bacteroidales bacterium]|nr:copper homeostasis protein CutC [Bacteroidales bacterium]